MRFERYVALGDSQTEGLNDLHADGSPRGWADRLAEALAATTSPGLEYANLAVRGCRAAHVHDVQLPSALELEPDLATVVVGANDLLRHDYDADGTAERIEDTFAALTATGCTVLTMTIPDVGRMLPVLSWLRPREIELNRRIAEAAGRHGVAVLDVFPLALCGDHRMWSHDRIHGSTLGHTTIAAGMAHLMGLPGSDPAWHELPPPERTHSTLAVVARDAWWAATFAVPFLTRQLRGRGPMSTNVAKRPSLSAIRAPLSERP